MDQKPNDIAKKILEADTVYYNTGHSNMSDQEYDSLKTLLKQMDPEHPLFSKVGNSPKASPWEKASHQIPMGSLDKANTLEEFETWAQKYQEETFVLEPKLDGLSLSMVYEKGIFEQALTRGDGIEGEDISVNVRNMKNFRDVLKQEYSGALRCEIILPAAYLEQINSILPEADQYENCRNAASGISRRLYGRFTQYLQLMYYDVGLSINEDEKIIFIRSLGLDTVVYSIGDKNAIISAYNQLKEARKSLPYKIDGSVIKINSWLKQYELGIKNNRPKGQIAWKFDPPGSATTLLRVSWEVGRTGVVTPLGHVFPVLIDGSTISNVTLHNVAEISRLNLGINDIVMLVKCGDIIPKITSVIEHKWTKISIPTDCPSCGAPLDNDGIRLFCRSDVCPAKNHFRIMNWIKVVGIDNLGEATIETLENPLDEASPQIKAIKDIYSLTLPIIASVTGGDKSAEKIFNNIQGTKTLPLQKFLAGIGIPSLSIKTAEDLVKNFKTIDKILAVTIDDLNKIKGYSDISSAILVKGLYEFKKEILDLLTVIKVDTIKQGNGKLSGMAFCFTGAMASSRPYYQGLVTKNGGRNDSTVTKTTSYLVCNENKGSSKSLKAEKLGVKIITEQGFLDLLGEIIIPRGQHPILKTYSLFDEEI
jgi:DNA ligase (NAD+)